ncbi:MAG: low molecular weight protein tyrosine phosphatase family protein [Methyloligellaceae bacterium]
MNLLFICSRNQWRSPTAEQLWRKSPEHNARSAGTSPKAKRTVNAGDIVWADIIFVMENKHRSRLQANFPAPLKYKTIHVLDIPDEYQYMDPELIEILQERIGSLLEENE